MLTKEQQARIGPRLRALRERRRATQTSLAAAMGIADRQTVSAIEAGERGVSPQELARAAEFLDADPGVFVDPFQLLGEGEFSFRARGVDEAQLLRFQEQAGRWIATYREVSKRLGEQEDPLASKLELTARSSFEEAVAAAEELWRRWDLGEVPAARLERAISTHLSVLVLYVDAPTGISGAASHLARYSAILVNRNEAAVRRSYDLAHELFHILTWDAMRPKLVESIEIPRTKGNRVEHLADNFAAGLLMPSRIIQDRWQQRGQEVEAWVTDTAAELQVSEAALAWRLANLRLMSVEDARALATRPRLRVRRPEPVAPPLFSRRFVARIAAAIEAGHLALTRAASLLGVEVDELTDLCRAYDTPLSYAVGR